MSKESTFNKETKQELIEKLKAMTSQCLKIVGQSIDADLKDDKLYNALKAKRQAAEDADWASLEVDRLTNELNNVQPKEKKKEVPKNIAERYAK